MKTRNIFFLILFVALITQFCEKIERITMIKIGDAENERSQTVTVNAEIVDLNESETFLSYGFCWSKGENPTLADLSLSNQGTPQKGNYKEELKGLTPDTKYYFRAYILTSADTLYTQQNFFRTQQGQLTNLPVETYEISNYTNNSVTLQVNIVLNESDTLTEKGLVWGTEQNPTKSDNFKLDESEGTGINLEITELESNSTIYIRAFAEINGEIIYSTQKQVTTNVIVEPGEITIVTSDIKDTTATSAICGGEIISDGNQTILKKGVCWSLGANPTMDDSIEEYSGTEDTFTIAVTGLQPSTIYHVRAFAYSATDTSYGADKNFMTLNEEPENPVDTLAHKGLITFRATNIGADSATMGGYVSGSLENIGEKGLCISTSPGACEMKKATNESDNIFYINSSGLNPSTKYYIRAYAVINGETKYGNEIEFSTHKPYVKVYTKNLTHINENSAKGGGYIAYGGNYTFTERGVEWSTSEDFSSAQSITYSGTSADTFNIDLTGLDINQVYFVRAYAKANGETFYADSKKIKTVEVDDEIQTIGIREILVESAILDGKLYNENISDYIYRAGCSFGTDAENLTSEQLSSDDKEGDFSIEFNVGYDKTYYARAMVELGGMAGDKYGELFMFDTPLGVPFVDIISIEGLSPTSVTISIDYSRTIEDMMKSINSWNIFVNEAQIIPSTGSLSQYSTNFSSGTIETKTFTDLTPGSTYYVRGAVGSSKQGSGYSLEYSFTTPKE